MEGSHDVGHLSSAQRTSNYNFPANPKVTSKLNVLALTENKALCLIKQT